MVMIAASQGFAKLITIAIAASLSICSGQVPPRDLLRSLVFRGHQAIGSRNTRKVCDAELGSAIPSVDLSVSILGAKNLKAPILGDVNPFVDVRVSQVFRTRAKLPEDSVGKGIVLAQCSDGISVYNTIPVAGQKSPVWDETTMINNLPKSAFFEFRLWHQGYKGFMPITRYIGSGQVSVDDLIRASVSSIGISRYGLKEGDLIVKVEQLKKPAVATRPTFSSGPRRWRRSYSRYPRDFLMGNPFTSKGHDRGYYVYEVDLHYIDNIFGDMRLKMYDNHKITKVLRTPVIGSAVARVIGIEHSAVSSRGSSIYGHVYDARGFFDMFEWGTQDGKPIVYTYSIVDGQIRFSETDPNVFYTNMLSKHLVLANVAKEVVFAGELFVVPADKVPRNIDLPRDAISAKEEPKVRHATNLPESVSSHAGEELPLLVMDNSSGTFRPPKELLGNLERVFRVNFPGIKVIALPFNDERKKILRDAAGITTAMEF